MLKKFSLDHISILHSLRIGDLQKVNTLRLKLGELSNGQLDILDLNDLALADNQIAHHPERQITSTLFGNELEHTAMCSSVLALVHDLKQHGIFYVQPS